MNESNGAGGLGERVRRRATGLVVALTFVSGTAGFVAVAGPSNESATARAQCESLGLQTCPEPFDRDLPRPAEMLTWDQPTRIVGFRNTYRLYRGDVIHTQGAAAYPLNRAAHPLPDLRYAFGGHEFGIADYLSRESVTGLLVVKDGQIAYEYYGGGNTERTLWTSRSVAKSVVSVLVGIAVRDGLIHSLADPVTRYLPELKGTAWEPVSVKQLIQHTSGVAWDENYRDPDSDFAHLTRCEALPDPYDCVFGLVSSVKRVSGAEPGRRWSYNTGGAWLLGRLLERATGMTIARYMETRLWSRFAMEHDAVWQALKPGEADMGGHGFNATLRDWGRFALFVGRDGKLASGESLLPAGWIADSTAWTKATGSVTREAPNGHFGYQWWLNDLDPANPAWAGAVATAQKTFWALGIYGQAIAINPTERLVMVQWSAWPDADAPSSLYDEEALFFDALARSLRPPAVRR